MKKSFIYRAIIVLLVVSAVCYLVNDCRERVKQHLTDIERLPYHAEYSYCNPKDVIEDDAVNVNEEARALLLQLGLEERFIAFLSEQTLQAYARSDVLRVVIGKPEEDEKKNVLISLTVSDVKDNVFVSVDIELPRVPEQRFTDIVGVAMDAPMAINGNSFTAFAQFENQEIVPLVLNEDFSAEQVDRGVGFSFDLAKLTDKVGAAVGTLRLHSEYNATYSYPGTTVNYNAYVSYEHLAVPYDGHTKIGRTNEGVCYSITEDSIIISDRHFIISPEPFVAYQD